MLLLILIIVLDFLIIFALNGGFRSLLALIDEEIHMVRFRHKANFNSHFFVFLRSDRNLLLFAIFFNSVVSNPFLENLSQLFAVIFELSFLVKHGNHLDLTKNEPLDHVRHILKDSGFILSLKVVDAKGYVTQLLRWFICYFLNLFG